MRRARKLNTLSAAGYKPVPHSTYQLNVKYRYEPVKHYFCVREQQIDLVKLYGVMLMKKLQGKHFLRVFPVDKKEKASLVYLQTSSRLFSGFAI